MRPRRGFGLLVAALLLAACGSTASRHMLYGPQGPAYVGRVRFTRAGGLSGRTVREVAIVHAVGRGSHADTAHVLQSLEAEAAALGCDVVLRLRVHQGSSVAVGVGVAVRSAPAGGAGALVGPVAPWAN